MPKPKIELAHKYFTMTQARKKLGLSRFQFDLRIKRGVFPPPTLIDNTGIQYVRYFDDNWLRIAQLIVDNDNQELKAERDQVKVG